MKEKQYAIEKLEDILMLQEQHLEHFTGNIKNLYNDISITDAQIVKTKFHISVLKDAIHKLEGLDNLEKKNKIHPDYVVEQKIKTEKGFVVKDVTGFDIHKFARDLILPDIIEMLKDRNFRLFTVYEEGK